MEEAAPEPGHGNKGHGGSAHQATGEHKPKCRVGQAQEALRDLLRPDAVGLGDGGGRERWGLEAKPKRGRYSLQKKGTTSRSVGFHIPQALPQRSGARCLPCG